MPSHRAERLRWNPMQCLIRRSSHNPILLSTRIHILRASALWSPHDDVTCRPSTHARASILHELAEACVPRSESCVHGEPAQQAMRVCVAGRSAGVSVSAVRVCQCMVRSLFGSAAGWPSPRAVHMLLCISRGWPSRRPRCMKVLPPPTAAHTCAQGTGRRCHSAHRTSR